LTGKRTVLMKQSRDFYLRLLSNIVEDKLEREKRDLPRLTEDTTAGILSVFDDYLFSVWLNLGDTAFNKLGYRKVTDDLLEQLKKHV